MAETPFDDNNELSDDGADILSLLTQLRFAHWHGALLLLCNRFDGWYAAYEASEESTPDYRPMCELLATLRSFPVKLAGDDLALAHVVASSSFISWSARDHFPGAIAWNPLVEPYTAFMARHVHHYPYWPAEPIVPVAAWVTWMLTQLPVVNGRVRVQ